MTHYFSLRRAAFAVAALVATTVAAQEVEEKHFTDFNPDPLPKSKVMIKKTTRGDAQRPNHVDNSKTKYYPPVFNQAGGSCGSASNEAYNLTYELNAYRDTDASLPENQLPSHFIYLLAYQNSDREEIAQKNGVPSVVDYGGRTYSQTFGEQECRDNDNGRMQGYDKWYRAMFNRAWKQRSFRYNLASEQGREEFKQWIWNHCGDEDFHSGGVACLGVAITGSQLGSIAPTLTNKNIGVANKKYITTWGKTFDHSVTIVGYDDRIQFDLDGNGKFGEEGKEETGAWIVCNSWGTSWANGGFVYCPYKYSYAVERDKSPMDPYVWIIRKDYAPKRTLRIEMEYSHRAELQLKAGISTKANATTPAQSTIISCFNFDGNPNDLSPAPAVPMLGSWHKKPNTDPMEFGFDVTDLSESIDRAEETTYFLQINSAKGAIGSGKVHRLSFIDYENGEQTIEALAYGEETVDIKNGGKTTYVKVTVPGTQMFSPQSPRITASTNTFSWKAPKVGPHTIKEYVIYQAGNEVVTVPATELSYAYDTAQQGYLQVAARYDMGNGVVKESYLSDYLSPVATTASIKTKLSCELDGRYLALLRNLVGGRLTNLDLSEATIVEDQYPYYDNYTPEANTMCEYLFDNCTKLKEVIMPNNIEVIGKCAFSHCDALTSMVVPDNVVAIKQDAFAYCKNLSRLTIGSSVASIGQGIVWDSPVKTVYAKPLVPPTLGIYNFLANPTIHVYPEALDAYKASAWGERGTLVGDLDKYIPREETAIEQMPQAFVNGTIYTPDGLQHQNTNGLQFYIRDGRKFWNNK